MEVTWKESQRYWRDPYFVCLYRKTDDKGHTVIGSMWGEHVVLTEPFPPIDVLLANMSKAYTNAGKSLEREITKTTSQLGSLYNNPIRRLIEWARGGK